MARYVGGRIVPTHGGVWDGSKNYEELTIVLREDTGDSYISKRPVPAGTAITEEHYWVLYSVYNEQITRAEQHLDSTVSAIRSEMNTQKQQVTERMEQAEENVNQRASAAENLSNQNRSVLESRMELIEARQEANVHASTDADADYAAEVVDARVDGTGKVQSTLGAHLRAVENGEAIIEHGITREKINDISFEQICFDGLDVFSFDGLIITKGKQFTGYNTETFLPEYSGTTNEDILKGMILDFPISNLVERDVEKLYIPMGAPQTQKVVVYTEGEKANNSAQKYREPVDGCFEILITTLTQYDRIAISFAAGNVYLNAERDLTDNSERLLKHWIGSADIKEGAITEDKLDEELKLHLQHYPFDHAKPTTWQTEKNRHFKDGAVRYVRVYGCDPNLDYGISRVWSNHISAHTRTVGIASFDRVTHEQIELLGWYSAQNENDETPEFIETIQITRQGKPLADLVFDWSKEQTNDWESMEILCTDVCLTEGKMDRAALDKLYEVTDSRAQDIIQKGFPFTGNLVSQSTGKHRVSRAYDTSTHLPIWLEDDNYREFTLPCPRYGYWHITRNDPEDTQIIQRYAMDQDGKVILNFGDKPVREENWSGVSVTEEEMRVNCAVAYAHNVRFFSFTFDLRKRPDFSICANGNYIPDWLGVEEMRKETILSPAVEAVLPANLRICDGIEMNLYFQNVLRYMDADKCQLVRATGSFTGYRQFARYTPAKGTTGSFKTNIQLYLRDTKSIDLLSSQMTVSYTPETAGSGKTKRILCIGDSLTDADAYTGELASMFEDDPMSIELLGTLGNAPNRNEGYSGWRAFTFAKCSGQRADWATWSSTVPAERLNPFWNAETETFDFSMYMENQGYESVDYVFICLGTNDIARGNYKSEAELKEYFDSMIDSIHSYDPDIRIGLWLPPTRSLMENRNRQGIDLSLWMNKWLIETYDNREDERIYLVPVYLNVDPYHDYRASVVPVSSRNTEFTMTVDTDSVHPARVGYNKIADVIYSYIKYFAYLDE